MFESLKDLGNYMRAFPSRWLVTGGAGFIGSHVVENLLQLNQEVTVLDATKDRSNLQTSLRDHAHLLNIQQGDIRDELLVKQLCRTHARVIHLAAMGSVPMSIEHPELCHDINVTGTFHVFHQAILNHCQSVVYASSSAVYGDDTLDYKIESRVGKPLSPYGASKWINEIYAQTLSTSGQTKFRGMRFFNVFGSRQNPRGPYAAVIPIWIESMLRGQPVFINGNGENTRDFCFVKDVAQAIILASLQENEALSSSEVYNVGLGRATSLLDLFASIRTHLQERNALEISAPMHREARPGDILHSCADTRKVTRELNFKPQYTVDEGLKQTVAWYAEHLSELAVK